MNTLLTSVTQKNIKSLLIFSFCVLIALVLGWLDYITGYELSFSVFYLLPIYLAAWYIGPKAGILLCGACAAIWQVSNIIAGEVFSNPAFPFWNAITRLGFFLIVTVLLSRLKNALDYEKSLARVDFLTGVLNSRAFDQIASTEIQRLARYSHPIALAYLDLDNFKAINDTLGHSTGDSLLKTVASAIRENLRSTDHVARLGGDEFAILMPETGEEAALTVVARVQSMIEDRVQKNHWPVTTSIGIVTCMEAPPSVDRLIQMADEQMYVCKKNGKDCIHATVFPDEAEHVG